MPPRTPTRGRERDPEDFKGMPLKARKKPKPPPRTVPNPARIRKSTARSTPNSPTSRRTITHGYRQEDCSPRRWIRGWRGVNKSGMHVCWAPRPPQQKKTRRRGHPILTTTYQTVHPPPGQSGELDPNTKTITKSRSDEGTKVADGDPTP
jgi:hypothetical protein